METLEPDKQDRNLTNGDSGTLLVVKRGVESRAGEDAGGVGDGVRNSIRNFFATSCSSASDICCVISVKDVYS